MSTLSAAPVATSPSQRQALRADEPLVEATLLHQVVVRPQLHNLASIQHRDLVCRLQTPTQTGFGTMS